MVVLERTRESVLRCIGAHARDVRRIFATEGLVIVLDGWQGGIPLGFGLAHAVVSLAENVFNGTCFSYSPPLPQGGTYIGQCTGPSQGFLPPPFAMAV